MIRADLLLSQALSELTKESSKEEKEDSKIERVIAILTQLVRATENQELSINVEAPNVSVNPSINIPKQDSPTIEVNVPQSPEPRVTVEPQITVNVPEAQPPVINLPEPIVNVTFEAKGDTSKAEYEVEVDRAANGMIAKLRIRQF